MLPRHTVRTTTITPPHPHPPHTHTSPLLQGREEREHGISQAQGPRSPSLAPFPSSWMEWSLNYPCGGGSVGWAAPPAWWCGIGCVELGPLLLARVSGPPRSSVVMGAWVGPRGLSSLPAPSVVVDRWVRVGRGLLLPPNLPTPSQGRQSWARGACEERGRWVDVSGVACPWARHTRTHNVPQGEAEKPTTGRGREKHQPQRGERGKRNHWREEETPTTEGEQPTNHRRSWNKQPLGKGRTTYHSEGGTNQPREGNGETPTNGKNNHREEGRGSLVHPARTLQTAVWRVRTSTCTPSPFSANDDQQLDFGQHARRSRKVSFPQTRRNIFTMVRNWIRKLAQACHRTVGFLHCTSEDSPASCLAHARLMDRGLRRFCVELWQLLWRLGTWVVET